MCIRDSSVSLRVQSLPSMPERIAVAATNAQARRVSVHSPARLFEVATQLNARPRKTLGGITPAKAMQRLLFDPERPIVATTARIRRSACDLVGSATDGRHAPVRSEVLR